MEIRNNWTLEEVKSLYQLPILDLIFKSASIHRAYHSSKNLQMCSLISIKTGGCPEDCKYCPQSSRYKTDVNALPLMELDEVIDQAKRAIEKGATRICLGAAWRNIRNSAQFDRVLEMVKEISSLEVEVCCCLGMLDEEQAKRLKEAGIFAYNHNLDTSRDFYPGIISTRAYDDRLQTLQTVEEAGISVCCGGIIGMGESIDDRLSLLHTLATRAKHPESVPINLLIPVKGTPLESQLPVPIWDLVRVIATARILMPKARVRLSAGREGRTLEEHALCFLAGVNSIFMGDKLLTRSNREYHQDIEMLKLFELIPCK